MMNWIRDHMWLVSLLGGAVIVVSTVAVSRYQLSGLMENQPAIHSHIHDTTRHLDPMRDGMSQKHLVDRLERLEEQVRRMERRQVWTAEEIRRRRDSR